MYDLVILGAGSAGFAAAIKASELGKQFALIERGALGGTCVNVGCVPTKFLLRVSDFYYSIRDYSFRGVNGGSPVLDFVQVMDKKDELVQFMRKNKYEDVLNHLSGGTLFHGEGSFISRNEVKVGEQVLRAKKFLIATGASPHIISIKGIQKAKPLTSTTALELQQLPESMIVIGGRALGLEFAQLFARLGTKVTILQRSSRILPADEPEITQVLTDILRDEGIQILTGVKILEVIKKGKSSIVKFRMGSKDRDIEAEQLLMATGRKANIEHLGLKNARVETEKGFVKTNEFLQTSNPDIYAAGDCASQVMLEPLAAKMGNLAVRNAFENARLSVNWKTIPSVVFTNPQVARVGFTDEEYSCIMQMCTCRTIPLALLPKAHIIDDTRGVIKMVTDSRTLKIVGVHIVSSEAMEMIHEATLAVKFGLTVDDIIETVHVFPTMSEAIKLVAQSFRKDVTKLSCCSE
ncbi:MAG: mercury(II) reductase [Promethearchaeota archaeon]